MPGRSYVPPCVSAAVAASRSPAGAPPARPTRRSRDALETTDPLGRRGDERCLPPDDPRSNEGMARESLLDRVPIPERVFPMRCMGDAEAAATSARSLPEPSRS